MIISCPKKYFIDVEVIPQQDLGIIENLTREDITSDKKNKCDSCSSCGDKWAIKAMERAVDDIMNNNKNKANVIWLETSGCFGEIISLLDARTPDVVYLFENIVNMNYLGSVMGSQGEKAYEKILDSLNEDYIFIVCGAISTKDNGLFTTIATYNGERITAMKAVKLIAEKAKHIIALGTCACYGGPTAGKPNVSEAISVPEYLKDKSVIRIPGCPANPVWTMGILGYIVSHGAPEVDSEGRPTAYYGSVIHESCPRRGYFDNGIFAKKFGDPECMFMLGCKGPITKAYCPISRWNQSDNWPVGSNTTCIGCAGKGFPDENSPYVKYKGDKI